MRNLIIVLFISITSVGFYGCEQEKKDFTFLEEEMIRLGYYGDYEKPTSTIHYSLLALMGIDDLLVYRDNKDRFIFLQIENTETKEKALGRIDSVIDYIDRYLSDEDKENITESRKKLDEHSLYINEVLVIWENEKPEQIINLITATF